jgi:hypothetical protein
MSGVGCSTNVVLSPRMPLYIPCVYVVFMYFATVSVWRLRLRSAAAEAALTGLVAEAIYAPYDIVGAKFLWWSWHDTDAAIRERLFGAPLGSSMVRPGPPRRFSARSVSHSTLGLYGGFAWACNGAKRRFPARAVGGHLLRDLRLPAPPRHRARRPAPARAAAGGQGQAVARPRARAAAGGARAAT